MEKPGLEILSLPPQKKKKTNFFYSSLHLENMLLIFKTLTTSIQKLFHLMCTENLKLMCVFQNFLKTFFLP